MGEQDMEKGRSDAATVSRRGFLTTAGAGAVGAVALRSDAEAAGTKVIAAGDAVAVTLQVNGASRSFSVAPNTTLLEVLRGELGLLGAKPGCERGECGACTVLIDGQTRYSCQTLAVEADGSAVTTVEGLMEGEQLGPVQRAFVEEDAFQCGFCTCGQVVAVEGLLRANPNPSPDEILDGLSGNLCRCGAYAHIVRATSRAAELRKG